MRKLVLFFLPLLALVISCAGLGSPAREPSGVSDGNAALAAPASGENARDFDLEALAAGPPVVLLPAEELSAAEPHEPVELAQSADESAISPHAEESIAAEPLAPELVALAPIEVAEQVFPEVLITEAPPAEIVPDLSLAQLPPLAFAEESEPEIARGESALEAGASAEAPSLPAAVLPAAVAPPVATATVPSMASAVLPPILPQEAAAIQAQPIPPARSIEEMRAAPVLSVAILEPLAVVPLPVELPLPIPDLRNLLPSPRAFSRVAYATVGQLIEVPFHGSDWVFLGEADGRRGIGLDSRALDGEGVAFFFRAEAAGEYALRFYRQDFVRDFILNDHVRVVVAAGDGSGASAVGTVAAERWPAPIDEARFIRAGDAPPLAIPTDAALLTAQIPVAPANTEPPLAQIPENADSAPAQTSLTPAYAPPIPAQVPALPPAPAYAPPIPAQAPADADPTPVPVSPVPAQVPLPPMPVQIPEIPADAVAPPIQLSPFDLLQMAGNELAAGRIAEAIGLAETFMEFHPSGSDEALWLLGQLFEANSPHRNILRALGYYQRLVREFPQSGRLTDARARIAFIERFFLHIR